MRQLRARGCAWYCYLSAPQNVLADVPEPRSRDLVSPSTRLVCSFQRDRAAKRKSTLEPRRFGIQSPFRNIRAWTAGKRRGSERKGSQKEEKNWPRGASQAFDCIPPQLPV